MSATAGEYLRQIYGRPAPRRDLELEHVTAERDMLARRLAEMAHKRAELKMITAKAVTVLGRHKEHADCRRMITELVKRLEEL